MAEPAPELTMFNEDSVHSGAAAVTDSLHIVDFVEVLDPGPEVRAQTSVSRRAIFVSLMIGYMGYYLCRQNFSEAFPLLRDQLHLDKRGFGAIASAGTLVYAMGKLLGGPYIDARGGRLFFLVGLFGVCVASLFLGLAPSAILLGVFWCFNRGFQSLGWGSMVSILGKAYPKNDHGVIFGALSVSYQLGGVVASLFAGLLLAQGIGRWGLFALPAVLLATYGLWLIKVLPVDQPRKPSRYKDSLKLRSLKKNYGAVLQTRFLLVCSLSLILTFLREFFTFWLPTYFFERGANASQAAIKTAFFPLLGCIGSLLCGWISDRWWKTERLYVAFGSLILFIVACLALFYGDAFVHDRNLILGLVCCAGLFLFGPYSMIAGGVMALELSPENAATAAGVLDFAGYLGAAIAGLGGALLIHACGWSLCFVAMAALASLSIFITVFAIWQAKTAKF